MCCCTFKDFIKWVKRRVLNCWIGCKTPDCIWWGICRCPHGPCYTVMGVLMAFISCWMNMYVIMSCKFTLITELNPVTGEPILITKRGYGLIAREIAYGDEENYRGCILYPDEEAEYMYDFWLTWARNLAFLGGFLGLITFTCLIGACCFLCESWNFERWLLWCSLWASICMAFTNLIFGNWFCTDNVCKVSYGTGYAISAFMSYLMLANQVKSMAQPPVKHDMPAPGGREDDLWYDNEDERFLQDSDDEDDKDRGDDDDDDAFEEFEDENDDDRKKTPQRPWQRRLGSRRRPPPPNDMNGEEGAFVNNESRDYDYDEMAQYMQPEEKYAPKKDDDFFERDKEHQDRLAAAAAAEHQHQQQQQPPPQPMPRYYSQPGSTMSSVRSEDPFEPRSDDTIESLSPQQPSSSPPLSDENPFLDPDRKAARATAGATTTTNLDPY